VAAIAVAEKSSTTAAISKLIAQPPRDPRFRVTWDMKPTLHVLVDAVDKGHFLNDLKLTLETWDPDSGIARTFPLEQAWPGRYEISAPSGQHPSIATVKEGEHIIDRTALAGWYAAQFSAVGEDRAALESIARQSGGRVILPGETAPNDFKFPKREIPITSWLATAGALCLATGLLAWKIQR
jgi:hypothetical protein